MMRASMSVCEVVGNRAVELPAVAIYHALHLASMSYVMLV